MKLIRFPKTIIMFHSLLQPRFYAHTYTYTQTYRRRTTWKGEDLLEGRRSTREDMDVNTVKLHVICEQIFITPIVFYTKYTLIKHFLLRQSLLRTVLLSMTLDFWSSSFLLPSAGIMSVYHQIQHIPCWRWNPGKQPTNWAKSLAPLIKDF